MKLTVSCHLSLLLMLVSAMAFAPHAKSFPLASRSTLPMHSSPIQHTSPQLQARMQPAPMPNFNYQRMSNEIKKVEADVEKWVEVVRLIFVAPSHGCNDHTWAIIQKAQSDYLIVYHQLRQSCPILPPSAGNVGRNHVEAQILECHRRLGEIHHQLTYPVGHYTGYSMT